MKNSKIITLAAGCCLTATLSLSANLVGYWSFDNSDLDESSGFRADGVHDGVAVGTVAYSTDTPLGLGGRSLDLSGGNNAVQVLNSNEQNLGSGGTGGGVNPLYQGTFDTHLATQGEMTIAFWVKGWPVGDNWQPFVSKLGEGCCGYQIRRHSNLDSPTFTLRGTEGDDDPTGAPAINDGEWHHLAGVWDLAAGSRKLYVDGVLSAINTTGEVTVWSVPRYEFLVFGARDSGGAINDFAQTKLDDIRIYDNALTLSEINALVNAVPEPNSLILLGLGLVACLLRRKKGA